MFLGVPYHVARIYGDGRDNLVASPDRSVELHYFAEFLHSFRMEAFFVVAGFFSWHILRRQDVRVWMQGRLVRVLLPAVVCAILFAPVRAVITTLYDIDRGRLAADALARHVWIDRYLDQPYMIMHLWFLFALALLSAALAIATLIFRRWPILAERISRLEAILGRFHSLPPLIGLSAIIVASTTLIYVAPGERPFWPMFFVHQAWLYAPFFFVGAAMAYAEAFRRWMVAFDWSTPVIAILFSSLYLLADAGLITPSAKVLLTVGAGLYWCKTILSFGDRYFTKPSRLIDYLCDASFSVYLFHLPIALLLAIPLLSVDVTPALEWLMIVCATTALSVLAHELIRRSRLLSLFFNGVSFSKYRRKNGVMGETGNASQNALEAAKPSS